MRKIMALSLALQTISGTALAQCPTSEALAAGIRFGIDGGDTETFRSFAPGVIVSLYEAADPPASRVLLAQGVYLLDLIDIEDGKPQPGTRTTYSYPMKPPDMPVPQPGGSWSVTAAVFDMGDLRSEEQVYSFGAAATATYGTCRYDMVPITITYPGDTGDAVDVLHYLPSLGLSYLAQSTYDGTTDRYDYTSIEAVD